MVKYDWGKIALIVGFFGVHLIALMDFYPENLRGITLILDYVVFWGYVILTAIVFPLLQGKKIKRDLPMLKSTHDAVFLESIEWADPVPEIDVEKFHGGFPHKIDIFLKGEKLSAVTGVINQGSITVKDKKETWKIDVDFTGIKKGEKEDFPLFKVDIFKGDKKVGYIENLGEVFIGKKKYTVEIKERYTVNKSETIKLGETIIAEIKTYPKADRIRLIDFKEKMDYEEQVELILIFITDYLSYITDAEIRLGSLHTKYNDEE